MRAIIASLSFALVACSHNPLDSGAGNNPGTGTNTILVTGSAHAASDTPNATLDTSFSTDLQLDVSINNMPLTTGTVQITSHTGTATLVHQGGGQWTATIANYDPVYELNVISGSDNIRGVFLEGPDLHVFTAPAQGATVDATMTMTLTWTRQNAASQAQLDVGSIQALVIPDSGTFAIPAHSLSCDPQQTQQNRVRLTRTNSIVPKGAVAGSMFTVDLTQTLDVLAMPAAGC